MSDSVTQTYDLKNDNSNAIYGLFRIVCLIRHIFFGASFFFVYMGAMYSVVGMVFFDFFE